MEVSCLQHIQAKLGGRRAARYISPQTGSYGFPRMIKIKDLNAHFPSYSSRVKVFINDIRMPGEAQMLDRILNAFAKRFFETTRNENQYATEDTVYILSFSIMLLNTDLHNRNLPRKEKMRLEDFIRNNRGINAGRDLPPELLSTLYYSIKRKELRMKEGDMWESESLTFVAPRMSGWLEKQLQGQLGFCRFHRFWFVLTNGCLFYFSSPVDRNPRCIIILEAVMVSLVYILSGHSSAK